MSASGQDPTFVDVRIGEVSSVGAAPGNWLYGETTCFAYTDCSLAS